MEREQVLERVKALEPALRELGLGKLYLFGSVARGEPNPRDVDLLYEHVADLAPDFFRLQRAIECLEESLGKEVDLVNRLLLVERIRPRIEAEMIEVY